MSDRLNEILYRVTGEVLEKLAFIFSYPESEGDDIHDESLTAAKVVFAGPYSGHLAMVVSTAVLPELAANMAGVDEEETTADVQADTLKEVINIVCGNLLPKIFGRQTVFDVQAPQIIPVGEALSNADRSPLATATLILDEGRCEVRFFTDGDIPLEAMAGAV